MSMYRHIKTNVIPALDTIYGKQWPLKVRVPELDMMDQSRCVIGFCERGRENRRPYLEAWRNIAHHAGYIVGIFSGYDSTWARVILRLQRERGRR